MIPLVGAETSRAAGTLVGRLTDRLDSAEHALLAAGGALTSSALVDRFGAFALILLVAALTVTGVVATFSSFRRRHVLQRGRMDANELEAWRTDLIEKVGTASQTQGASVTLGVFWRDSGLSRAQRYVVLSDLLARQVIYPAYSSDGLVRFLQQLSWRVLHRPVSAVRLSDMNWQRLALGSSAGIVANGDVILVQDSPGAGVVSRSRGARQHIDQEVTPAHVDAIVRALRGDAQALVSGHPLREKAEAFADTLERESAAGEAGAMKATCADLLEFAANSAGLWASTLDILGVR